MRLRGIPPEGVPVPSYVGNPKGKTIGKFAPPYPVEVSLDVEQSEITVSTDWPTGRLTTT